MKVISQKGNNTNNYAHHCLIHITASVGSLASGIHSRLSYHMITHRCLSSSYVPAEVLPLPKYLTQWRWRHSWWLRAFRSTKERAEWMIWDLVRHMWKVLWYDHRRKFVAVYSTKLSLPDSVDNAWVYGRPLYGRQIACTLFPCFPSHHDEEL